MLCVVKILDNVRRVGGTTLHTANAVGLEPTLFYFHFYVLACCLWVGSGY